MPKYFDIERLRATTGIKDLLRLDQIVPFIYKRTGTLVSSRRVARWISSGELVVMRLPGRPSYRVTRKRFVDDLIRRYS